MNKTIPILLFIGLMIGCSSHQQQQQSETATSSGPRLKITAYPRQGFAPMRVSIKGTLDGVSKTDAEYFCLEEEWDFGDGAVSSEQPDCQAGDTGNEVKTQFFVEHVYSEKGNYTIWLTLGDEKIRSNQTAVVVLESELTPDR